MLTEEVGPEITVPCLWAGIVAYLLGNKRIFPAAARLHSCPIYDEGEMSYTVAAFYRFTSLSDPAALREELLSEFSGTDLRGTTLIATEGINGTMAGLPETIDRFLSFLAGKIGLDKSDVKFSTSEELPFGRLFFKVKQEIIAFRKARVDPTQAGNYVHPEAWNNLIANPEVLLLDTRNRYETEIGTFAGAVTPEIDTFSDFVTYVRENLDPATHPRVAMFCTGGIRCEKASAFMLQEGFREVHHLKGGILKYLEEVPPQESKWEGTCYVFDRRVAVGHSDFESKRT
jgi:UPF0176 protein